MDYRTFDRGCANSDKGYLKGEYKIMEFLDAYASPL